VKLTADEARRLLDWESEVAGLEYVDEKYIESRRWESLNLLVAKDSEGKLWGAYFRRGLTEEQYTEPWEYEEVVEFQPVVEKTVVTYEISS
jgi:hypothetical protein